MIVLDATFRELGRVSLGLGPGKDGHDVLMPYKDGSSSPVEAGP